MDPNKLRERIEAYVMAGQPVPPGLIAAYDDAEMNNERAMQVFTLCEQGSLPKSEQDPSWRWVPSCCPKEVA